MNLYLGIDVGAKGCIVYTFDWEEFYFIDYEPNGWRIFLETNKDDISNVMLEKVHAHPKQGVTSVFTFGEKYGWIKGVLEAFRIPYKEISPMKWQKLLKVEQGSGKQGIYKRIKEVYPQTKTELITKRGRLIDGRADSLGILNSYKYIKE